MEKMGCGGEASRNQKEARPVRLLVREAAQFLPGGVIPGVTGAYLPQVWKNESNLPQTLAVLDDDCTSLLKSSGR